MNAYRHTLGCVGTAGRAVLWLSVAFSLLCAAPLWAASESDYFNVSSGDWNTSSSWDTLHVPSPTGTVYIGYAGKTNPATATISGGTASCTNLNLGVSTLANPGVGSGTLNMNGGLLVAGGAVNCGGNANYGGTGIISQTAGTVVCPKISLGLGGGANAAPAVGSWTVAGGTVTNAGSTFLGQDNGGNGSMVLQSGGVFSATGNYCHIGYGNSASGLLTVSNGTFLIGFLYVGEGKSGGTSFSTGAVVQTAGSLIVSDSGVVVGYNNPSCGSWTMTGGTVTNLSTTTLGYSSGSTGTWTMTGGTVNTMGAVLLGAASGSLGSWTIAGGTLNSPGTFTLGKSGGVGTMLVQSGGTFIDTNAVNIGGNSGSAATGTLTVNDGTALINNLVIGTYPGAMGSLVQNPGSVIVTSNTVFLGSSSVSGASTGTWTMAGGVVTNLGSIAMGKYTGAVGTWTISGGTATCLGASIQVGIGGNGFLTVSNATLLATTSSVTAVTQNGSGGSGTILFHNAVAVYSNMTLAGANNANANLTIEGTSAVTNWGTLAFGSSAANFPCLANATMTGGTWWQGGAINVTDTGHGPGETGILTVAGGTFLPQSTISVGAFAGNVGSLNFSNVAVTLPSTLDVGKAGRGTVSVVNGSLGVNGTFTLGAASGAGQYAGLTMVNAAVSNQGVINISQGNSAAQAQSSVSQIGGSWLVSGTNSVNFGTAGAASYAVSNGVFQETGGTFTLGSATNVNYPAWISLTGTQRMFQVSNLVVNACGALTNFIGGAAGGVDITSSATGSLAIASTGVIALVYAQEPLVAGNYWGLRWLGTNHVTALTAFHTNVPSRLTWDASALGAFYTNQNAVGIYTGSEAGVGYTYVGLQVTKVSNSNKGTMLFVR